MDFIHFLLSSTVAMTNGIVLIILMMTICVSTIVGSIALGSKGNEDGAKIGGAFGGIISGAVVGTFTAGIIGTLAGGIVGTSIGICTGDIFYEVYIILKELKAKNINN